MNSLQFENIDYKDISYNYRKNSDKSSKEHINQKYIIIKKRKLQNIYIQKRKTI